jgi:hypothetical protein
MNMTDDDVGYRNVVYFTLDSPNTFKGFVNDYIYVLGGVPDQAVFKEHVASLVDRNSIKTMRLPAQNVPNNRCLRTSLVFQAILARRTLVAVPVVDVHANKDP